MTRRPRNQAGQTMVTFGLLMFLTTLLVCMSLSVVMKIRERIELQNAADAAAYSAATVAARGFNTIALSNRAQVSQMVAMGGVQSLISWTSLYRAHVDGARDALDDLVDEAQRRCNACRAGALAGSAGCSCECNDLTTLRAQARQFEDGLEEEERRLQALWSDADKAAGTQARALRDSAVSTYLFSKAIYEGDIRFRNRPQRAAYHVALAAAKGSPFNGEFRVPYANDYISVPELDKAVNRGTDVTARLETAMGTRGYSFVTGRGVDQPFTQRLAEVMGASVGANPRIAAVATGGRGSTHFGLVRSHGAQEVSDTYVWAEDHGVVELAHLPRGQGCFGRGAVIRARGEAYVQSSKDTCGCGEVHYWSGGGDGPAERHVLTDGEAVCSAPPEWVHPGLSPEDDWPPPGSPPEPCAPCVYDGETVEQGAFSSSALPLDALLGAVCTPEDATPGLWPPFLDHDKSGDPEDLFGQPKVLVIVQRDYKKRGEKADPWNVVTGLRSMFGGETELDNEGLRLQDGTDISLQSAMSSGVIYYHHFGGGGFREDANFLNPFWRSTLVPPDVDQSGAADVSLVLRYSQAPLAARAWRSLRDHGYRGF